MSVKVGLRYIEIWKESLEDAVQDILEKYGCTGTVGACAVLIPLLAALVLKKKE